MKISSLVLIALLTLSCGKNSKSPNTAVDARFDRFKAGFIDQLWQTYPAWASNQGYHNYDHILVVPSDVSRYNENNFSQANLDSLKTFDLAVLSDNNKADYRLIENLLKGTIWANTELRSFEWNPAEYNVAGTFAEMINNDYDSLDTRLNNLYRRMENVPAVFESAKKFIKNPTLEHTKLAIEQISGGTSVFGKDLEDVLKKSKLSDTEKKNILARAKEAVKAMNDYVTWLRKLDNKTPRSFRLGSELYAKKFEFDILSAYTADQMFEKATAHKKELHEKMTAIADKMWTKYFGNQPKPSDPLKLIKAVVDTLSVQHVKATDFQAAIEKQIPELAAFVQKKNLLYLDPTKPLVVRREPDYMAGVAGASISAPGPYDKNGNTYYNVGSLSGWPADRAESYLREYNHYILQILNIHEAIPGHYAQLVYANQSPSLIKSILGNGAMIEGWAVYTELMMLENGYGNDEPEMWLMYYKWNLRATCNTILDISVHTKNMSEADALHLLVDEAFQQKAEAQGKWRRVSLSQVQLTSYFTGYSEIYELRESLKKQMGSKFDLKAFHEKFLSYGSTPVKYIKELMLADLKK